MNIRFKLTLIILFIYIGDSLCQSDFRKGFIVTLEKDTIKGEVDYRSNSKNHESCIFKNGQGEIEYFPNEILGFGYVNDKFYSSQILRGSFVEVLVKGEISLYKSKDKYHLKKDTLLVDLESIIKRVNIDGKIRMKENSRWRGLILYLISDCLKNFNKIVSDMTLGEKSLTRLIVKYNECKGAEFTEFKVAKPWTRLDFGATAGILRSVIETTNTSGLFSYLDDSYSSIDPSIGVLISISSPRITEKIAFQGEIHFIKSSYFSLIEVTGSYTEYHDTFIDLSVLSIPLSFKYSFPEKKYGLFFQLGLNNDYHLNSNTRLLTERVSENSVNTFPERSLFEISQNQIGYWGGIGIARSYSKFKGSISFRYFQMPELNQTEGFEANNSRVSINLILFKK